MTDINQIFTNSVNSIISNIHTSLPGIVKSYDPVTNKATIQPALNKAYVTGPTPLPVLENVPVMFPNNIIFPINVDDYVLLVFIERSIDLWLSVGGQVTPDDPRKYDLSDAVAIPGLMPFTQEFSSRDNTSFQIEYAGSKIQIKDDGSIIIETASTVAIGTPANELLDIVSKLLGFLSTSLTTVEGAPIQGASLLPTPGTFYYDLQAQIDAIKGVIT